MKQKKVDLSLPLLYWDQTMFGVITVQEFKLRVTQLLSKALCLEEATMIEQHIQTQEKSALCLKCHMEYKENEFKNNLYFKSCKIQQPIHSEILQFRKNMSAGQFYPEKKKEKLYPIILWNSYNNLHKKDNKNTESVAELSRYFILDILIFAGTWTRNIR